MCLQKSTNVQLTLILVIKYAKTQLAAITVSVTLVTSSQVMDIHAKVQYTVIATHICPFLKILMNVLPITEAVNTAALILLGVERVPVTLAMHWMLMDTVVMVRETLT